MTLFSLCDLECDLNNLKEKKAQTKDGKEKNSFPQPPGFQANGRMATIHTKMYYAYVDISDSLHVLKITTKPNY